jgi:hypothetical protein
VTALLIWYNRKTIFNYKREIIYNDCLHYEPNKMPYQDYFAKDSPKVITAKEVHPIQQETSRELNNNNNNNDDDNNNHQINNALHLKENENEQSNPKIERAVNNFFNQDTNPDKVIVTITNNTENQQNGKIITIRDYVELEPINALKYDNRTNFALFKDNLSTEHSLFSLLFKKSLRDPIYLRLAKLIFTLSMQFTFNAMLITDNDIDANTNDPSRVIIIFNID